MNTASLTCEELVQCLSQGAVLVDVMTPEDFAAAHVIGAKNACVYEMVFLERITEYAPGRTTNLVVYDSTGSTRTAGVARERLLQAGYRTVFILSGGLAAWRAAGLPVEGTGGGMAEDGTQPQDGGYRIDTENSRLEWIGRNLGKRHFGSIAVQSGELVLAAGRLVQGNIVLDMNSIANQDLLDPAWNALLIRHLNSDDFFAVERFPTASFTLTGWEASAGGAPEAPNGIATGDLTIRDVTRSISFPAIVAWQQDGTIKAHAAFNIDRTLWNVGYGSCKLFERLGMHLVHDLISLELFVVVRRA